MAVSSQRLHQCGSEKIRRRRGDIQFERFPNLKHFVWATWSDVVTAATPLVHVLTQKVKKEKRSLPHISCQLWQLNKLQLCGIVLGPAYSYNCISATMQIQLRVKGNALNQCRFESTSDSSEKTGKMMSRPPYHRTPCKVFHSTQWDSLFPHRIFWMLPWKLTSA